MHGRIWLVAGLALIAFTGCMDDDRPRVEDSAPQTSAIAGAAFDEAATGTIEGQVTWQGPVPEVATFMVLSGPDNLPPNGKRLTYESNPYRPLVDDHGGVRDAMVFLRHVDPVVAGPWQHGPVLVEQIERRIHIVQDGQSSRFGFVRPGDTIDMVNRDPEYHSLRARGAAFFTLPFADADRVTNRRLDTAGVVELGSGAGYYWMNARLFVVEHPYYTRTDAAGRFRLEHVPIGHYEVVCSVPNWVVTHKERDPESGFFARLTFAPALERSASIEVMRGEPHRVEFQVAP
jgi:hypothetical protein